MIVTVAKANKESLGSRPSSDGAGARSRSIIASSQLVVSPNRISFLTSTSAFAHNEVPDLSPISSTSAVVGPASGKKYGPDDFSFLQDDMFEGDEASD
jgi:hypothetical protein